MAFPPKSFRSSHEKNEKHKKAAATFRPKGLQSLSSDRVPGAARQMLTALFVFFVFFVA
jgi:hypothetical protein